MLCTSRQSRCSRQRGCSPQLGQGGAGILNVLLDRVQGESGENVAATQPMNDVQPRSAMTSSGGVGQEQTTEPVTLCLRGSVYLCHRHRSRRSRALRREASSVEQKCLSESGKLSTRNWNSDLALANQAKCRCIKTRSLV